MTRILLACASRHGATAEIAEEIGDVLRREVPGAVVDVRDAAESGDVDGYDAVVLGSAVYMGRWLPAVRQLVEGCREILASRPVWLFSSGPLGDPPAPLDELAEVETIRTAIGARDHRVFAGGSIGTACVGPSEPPPEPCMRRRATSGTTTRSGASQRTSRRGCSKDLRLPDDAASDSRAPGCVQPRRRLRRPRPGE
jgi:menaquinone-dependent protoporphyrinogen oxidase